MRQPVPGHCFALHQQFQVANYPLVPEEEPPKDSVSILMSMAWKDNGIVLDCFNNCLTIVFIFLDVSNVSGAF
jgi:hypothetical protein